MPATDIGYELHVGDDAAAVQEKIPKHESRQLVVIRLPVRI